MKPLIVLFLGLCLAGLIACKKDISTEPPPPKPILLKDVIAKNLPSPYYHFDYDANKNIIKAGFSSNQALYDVFYNGNRISEMRNIAHANKDKVQYLYDPNKRVEMIKIVNAAGIVYRYAELTYGANNRLTKIEWEMRMDGTGIGFAMEQTLRFYYDGNGNLTERRDERHFIEGRQPAAMYIDRFEQYDNKFNVDDFQLLHVHDRHLVLLPGIQLQQNNPSRHIRTGDGVNFEITYSYVYENMRPVQKNGDMLMTNGSDAGKHFEVGYAFTYY